MSNVTQRVERERRLRRQQTDVERILWLRLRNRRLGGFKFKRQVPIDRYIADFVCTDARVIVELDGGQHATSATDAERTRLLEAFGYLILRFWNNEVLENLDGVLETILVTLNKQPLEPPHPTPLPTRSRVFPTSGSLRRSERGSVRTGEREPTARVARARN